MDELLKRGYEQFVKIDAGGQANVYRTVKNGVVYAIKVVRVENPLCPKLDDDLKVVQNVPATREHFFYHLLPYLTARADHCTESETPELHQD